jgi:hypothetical protein
MRPVCRSRSPPQEGGRGDPDQNDRRLSNSKSLLQMMEEGSRLLKVVTNDDELRRPLHDQLHRLFERLSTQQRHASSERPLNDSHC